MACERVRKLLQGTASLEFWPTFENQEVYPVLVEANNVIRELLSADEEGTEAADSTAADEKGDLIDQVIAQDSLNADAANFAKQNPLFYLLNPRVYNGQLMGGPCVGMAHYRDTAKINMFLNYPQVKDVIPSDMKLMWTVKPSSMDKNQAYFELIAIKANTRDGKAPLDGGSVETARTNFGSTGGSPEVSMTMNAEGARIWARMTADNIGKCHEGRC